MSNKSKHSFKQVSNTKSVRNIPNSDFNKPHNKINLHMKNDWKKGPNQNPKKWKNSNFTQTKSNEDSSDRTNFKRHKDSAFKVAFDQYKANQLEQKQLKEGHKKRKEEMNQALLRYKQAKSQKLKRMSKKTKKGQPIMKYWMESLLEKIQSKT